MAGPHPLSVQIRVHHLNENENLESILFSVKKGKLLSQSILKVNYFLLLYC